jgi:predicted dehydrogenase
MKFGVIGINHGHVYWMIKGLLSTGQAECVGYFAEEPELQLEMKRAFPTIPMVESENVLLNDPSIDLICIGAKNYLRAGIAIRAMRAGKDVFVDKPGATSLDQLNELERVQKETNSSWFVWFCERLPDPSSEKAIELVKEGYIGKFVNFIGIEPHKLNQEQRPSWMFNLHQYGGILNDLAIHPIEMFCQLIEGTAHVDFSRVKNAATPSTSNFQDFGEVLIHSQEGATAYIRTDWLSPESLPSYGDIRQIIIGTKGMIELRKTMDLTINNNAFTGHQLLLATHTEAPRRITFEKKSPEIFLKIIQDVNEGSNRCIPHDKSFLTSRLALQAQATAD